MKIKLLTRSSDLNEILLTKLNQIELIGETIDYNRPILPQIADVMLCYPLTEETKNMIGAKELALMKKSACSMVSEF